MATNSFREVTYQRYFANIFALYRQRQDLKSYLEVLLSITAVAIFFVFAIKPTLVTISDLLTKIQAEQQTSDALDTKIKNLGIAQNLFNQNEDKIKLLDQAVPFNPGIQDYIRQIVGLAQKENVSIQSMQTSNIPLVASSSAAPAAQSAQITFLATGDYSSLENMIKDIENLRRPANFIKFDLSIQNNVLNLTITPQIPYIQ
ncbi:MAG TPA: hypothetical protein VG895_04225 [Patescibacteria group bacterium]|nr:hypothetical protein [Patescibacteria group bacterium]